MKCPACGNSLTPIAAGGITVNACQNGCGGIWFDRLEFAKVDEPTQSAGEALLHIPRNPAVRVDRDQMPRLHCPRCGIIMMRHFFSVKRQVLVDECPECAGTWLDAGELATIRSEFKSDEERKKAAEAYFDEVFGKHLAELRAKDEANLERVQNIANMFRFLSPSHYLPGKPKSGAF